MAWEFIKCATGPEMNLKIALEHANAPVRRSVFLNPDFIAAFPAAEATLAALEGDRIRPGLSNWTAVEEMLASELSQALIGEKSAEDAINDANANPNPTTIELIPGCIYVVDEAYPGGGSDFQEATGLPLISGASSRSLSNACQ